MQAVCKLCRAVIHVVPIIGDTDEQAFLRLGEQMGQHLLARHRDRIESIQIAQATFVGSLIAGYFDTPDERILAARRQFSGKIARAILPEISDATLADRVAGAGVPEQWRPTVMELLQQLRDAMLAGA